MFVLANNQNIRKTRLVTWSDSVKKIYLKFHSPVINFLLVSTTVPTGRAPGFGREFKNTTS